MRHGRLESRGLIEVVYIKHVTRGTMEDAPPRPPLNSLASADAGIPEDDNVVENIVLDPSPDAHQASPRSLGAVAGSLSEEEETDDDSSNWSHFRTSVAIRTSQMQPESSSCPRSRVQKSVSLPSTWYEMNEYSPPNTVGSSQCSSPAFGPVSLPTAPLSDRHRAILNSFDGPCSAPVTPSASATGPLTRRYSTTSRRCLSLNEVPRHPPLVQPKPQGGTRFRGKSGWPGWEFVQRLVRWRKRSSVLRCDSGSPTTHAVIADIEYNELGSFSIERVFVCQGGVNTVRLLQLTRKSLLEEGQMVGANALVNEMWSCEVFQRSREVYEVRIRYGASIAKAYRNPPSEPVAVKEAKGIPGLMTILEASNA